MHSEQNDENDKYARKSDKAILTNSTISEHNYTGSRYIGEKKVKYPEYVQLWKIRFFYGELGLSVVLEAYLEGGVWYLENKKTVEDFLSISCIQRRNIFVEKIRPTKSVKMNWSRERERDEKVHTSVFPEGVTYFYGKPLENWKRNTLYGDGKVRKFAQKYANSMDRQNIKTWINNKNWNAEVKTHALSKSILWAIW